MHAGSSHSAQRVRQFFGAIAQRYDLTNRVLSGGLDVFWRKKAARVVRRWNPARILDLATGSGDLAAELARACPSALVVGADFSQPMLARARAKGVAHLVAGDGLRLPFAAETFDAVTVAFGLRNMESWQGALGEMARVLRPGGHALIMDFSMPPAPLLWFYRPYLRYILPRLAALVTGQRAVYEYFADSIERFPSGEEMRALMLKAGLRCENQLRVQGGIVTIHVATRVLPPLPSERMHEQP
jgi:demethylmenaquinone methyltransferase/2-methoxy-6-polyprenyl-1,4-benzoquinol methylase